MCVVYASAQFYVCIHTCVPAIFLDCLPPYILRQSLSLSPELTDWLDSRPGSSRDPPGPAPSAEPYTVTEWTTKPGFYEAAGELNSGAMLTQQALYRLSHLLQPICCCCCCYCCCCYYCCCCCCCFSVYMYVFMEKRGGMWHTWHMCEGQRRTSGVCPHFPLV